MTWILPHAGVTSCTSHPCLNGGTCSDESASTTGIGPAHKRRGLSGANSNINATWFKCTCKSSFVGGSCEVQGLNLSAVNSPFSGTTVGRHDPFSGCGSATGATYKFFIVLQTGQQITIGQTCTHARTHARTHQPIHPRTAELIRSNMTQSRSSAHRGVFSPSIVCFLQTSLTRPCPCRVDCHGRYCFVQQTIPQALQW